MEPTFYLFPNSPLFKVDLVYVGATLFCGLLALLFIRLSIRRLDMRNPRGAQNLIEYIVDFARDLASQTVGNERFANWILPFSFTMLIFLFISNWLGLIATINIGIRKPIPWLGITAADVAAGKNHNVLINIFHSPTASMSVALGLALMVWIMSHAVGLRHPKAYFKHYMSPMFPIHLLEEITNPITHGLRLYGNIFAGEALIGVLLGVPYALGWIPMGLPLLLIWLVYSAFVSTIQSYVFTILMCLYIGNKYHDPLQAQHA